MAPLQPDAAEPIQIDSSDDEPDLTSDTEPLIESIDTPMAEAAPITEIKDDGKPAQKPAKHIVSGESQWLVHGVSKLDDNKEFSEKFVVANHNWRLLIFPKGNNNKVAGRYLSVFLEACDLDEEEAGWVLRAQFWITLVNWADPEKVLKKEARHSFYSTEQDWGFAEFLPLSELEDPAAGWVKDDKLLLKAVVEVDLLQSSCYNSKTETGCVGLMNQGATCYLNSWLQTLFHINIFRQAVFHIPTTEEDEPAQSIALALQSIFYQLQFSNRAVSTKELTKSFGWDHTGAFMQEDVHEFNKILCDALDNKMKATKVEGVINKIMEGHILKFIECLHVDYKSTKRDAYMDIFLDVKGCKNVYESFDQLTAEEKLEGDNQYNAEGHGLQDAKIGDLFDSFPPVLQLHLKRFEYDFERDVRVKINDRYEFPEELDLDIDDRKYLSKDADTSKRNKFKLHSVLVHSGGTHGGHYYMFSRPDGQQWLRFDDEKVTKEEPATAVQEQYGGDGGLVPSSAPGFPPPLGPRLAKFSNAYMLLYIREEEWDTMMCQVPESDVAEHLRNRVKAEAEEAARKKREKEEAHRFTIIRVATKADFQQQIGSSVFLDLVDFSQVRQFRVRRETLLGEFRQQLEAELGVPRARQRLWYWSTRANRTSRPSRPVPPDADLQMVKDVRESPIAPKKSQSSELNLWLEDTEGDDASMSEQVMVFFKWYDPRKSQLSFVNCIPLHPATVFQDVAGSLAGKFSLPEQRIQVMEEVKSEPQLWIEQLKLTHKLASMDPSHGDIIVGQEALSPEEAAQVRHPTLKGFLEYTELRRLVTFKRLHQPQEEGRIVELLGSWKYQDIATALAADLQVQNWQLLRLTQYNTWSQMPRPHPMPWRDNPQTVDTLLRQQVSASPPVMYYEVLDLPLAELEDLRTFEVTLHDAQTEEVSRQSLRVHKDCTVADLLAELRSAAGERWATTALRLLKARESEIYEVFEDSTSVSELQVDTVYWDVMAHEVPAEEEAVEAAAAAAGSSPQVQPHLVCVSHIPSTADPQATHGLTSFGVPFVIAVSPPETVADVKARIQARLKVPDKAFADWKLKRVERYGSNAKQDYLEDGDLLLSKFVRRSGDLQRPANDADQFLGLEHQPSGKRLKRPAARESSMFEKPMKIG